MKNLRAITKQKIQERLLLLQEHLRARGYDVFDFQHGHKGDLAPVYFFFCFRCPCGNVVREAVSVLLDQFYSDYYLEELAGDLGNELNRHTKQDVDKGLMLG